MREQLLLLRFLLEDNGFGDFIFMFGVISFNYSFSIIFYLITHFAESWSRLLFFKLLRQQIIMQVRLKASVYQTTHFH